MAPPIERAKEHVRGNIKMVVVAQLPDMTVMFCLAKLTDEQLVDGSIPTSPGRYHYDYGSGYLFDEDRIVSYCREIRRQWPEVPIYRQKRLNHDPLVLWRG